MKKSVMTAAIAVAVGVGTVFGGATFKTEAASISNLKGQQKKIQEQRSNLKSDIHDMNSKIDDIRDQQADVKAEMKRLDFAISDTSDKITEKNHQIDNTKLEIAKLEGEVKVLQERIEKRNNLLKERVRSYQETGGVVNYLDVLMGASSFSDFIDRASAVATIMEADQDIIKQHEADKKELEDKQAEVENQLANLQAMAQDLEKMKVKLNTQLAEKNKLLGTLVQQEKSMHEEALEMEEQQQILAAQEAAVKKAIALEQARLKALEEARKKAAAAGKPLPVSDGTWTRPASGIITSGFGTRPEFRVGEFHYGVDIANRGGNVPILAAADGVVLRAQYSNSYGNYVIITHSINGQIYTTVYAHQRKLLVSTGDVVHKGQQIGIMGSTGDSTGQHLHFEVHRGEWVRNTVNAINPMSIVPF